MDIDDKLERVVRRHAELRDAMSRPDMAGDEFAKVSKEYASLTEMVEAVETFRGAKKELADLQSILNDADGDAEMKTMAEEESRSLKARLAELEHGIKVLLLPKDEADAKNAILEIRAGTGGEEAALFGANLYRMYQRYAEERGWKFEPISLSDTGIGGLKEAIVNVNGRDVFARLKFESGVHRVQRVPETENQGRVHTSAATVAVLPEVEEVDVQIETKDLRIDVYRAQGAGGQHVNKTESAVRITHLPTNIVVTCQDDKSQHKNRAAAMKVLRAKLYEVQREQLDSERSASRKSQVGSGDRSERIRTYNFPQGRVTDHRINLTLYKLDRVIDGDLDELIDALVADDQATRLAEAV